MTVALETLSNAVIVELFNLLAEKSVKKFSDKATGVARLTAALEATGNEVFMTTAEGEEPAEYDVRPIEQAQDETQPTETEGQPTGEAQDPRKPGKRGPAPTYGDDRVITNVKPNPKRAGTPSADRYALYVVGATIGDYIAAGGRRGDVAWDLQREFITLGE